MLNISERLPSYCLVIGTRIWKILSSCWERNEDISLEVCLSEECRYATCETRTLHGSVSHPPCADVCPHEYLHVLQSAKKQGHYMSG